MKDWTKFLLILLIGLPLCIVWGLVKGCIDYKPKEKKYKF